MTEEGLWLRRTELYLRLLLRFYPQDFREEMGDEIIAAYRVRAREALRRGGPPSLARVWITALGDSMKNGTGERIRPGITWRRGGNWGRDAELVLRRLTRAPVFVLSIVGTLIVGLGAFAVVYAVVDKVLIEPLPYEDSEDLYFAWRDYSWFDLDRGWLGGPDVAALQEAGGVIEGVAGLELSSATLAPGAGNSQPEEVAMMITSPNLFELLRARPALGRGFTEGEVGPGRAPVVVLGDDIWRSRFGADPGIIGSEIRLDDTPYTVIGVMGPDFRFVRNSSLGPPAGGDLYTTFSEHLAELNPGSGSYAGLIRARPGASPEAVNAAVAAVGAVIDERDFDGLGLRLYSLGAKSDLIEGVRPALVVLGLAGLLLVVVLMVNLATLLLVRGTQREREFAISRALGADQMALARATLLEGAVLGLLGGAGGALVAVWGTRAIVALAPDDLPRREAIGMDPGVAAAVIAIGGALGLLAATLPAVWAARARLSALLNATAVRGGGGQGRMRRGMVVVQVALALVLLSAGALVVRSFDQLLRTDPGFSPEGVLTLRVPVPEADYTEPADINLLHARLDAELGALPGVTSVGAVSALPLTGSSSQATFSFPDAPGNTGDEDHDRPLIDHMRIRPGYLETMGIPILAGRDVEAPASEGEREVVIDRTLAATFFPTGNPIGASMVYGDETLRVVGVAEHARMYDVHRDDRPQVYIRNNDVPYGSLSWVIRTDRSPRALVSEARAAVWRVDPTLPISDMQAMDEIVGDALRQERLSAVLISGFSLGALLLAAMGVFGVVAGAVTRRRHELAVRMALGAERSSVVRLVVREGMTLVTLGLLVGVPGIYFSAEILGQVLVGISPFDAPTLSGVAIGLAVVALAACYVPARRVSRIDPAALLRQE